MIVKPIREPAALPRWFAPSQTLEEQIQIFDNLCENAQDHANARIHVITPELAAWILENRHGTNRRHSEKKVGEYVSALEDNEWPVTGATIVFGKHKRLLDGQHRLLAIVRSNVAMKTFVVFGIDPGAFTLIDIGRRRTNLDAFEIAGIDHPRVAAKATRWIRILEEDPFNRSFTMSNADAINWYRDHVKAEMLTWAIETAVEIEKAIRKRGGLYPSGPLAALLYKFCVIAQMDMGRKCYEKVQEFAEQIINNVKWGKALQSVIDEALTRGGGTISEIYRNAVTIQAWNEFKQGKRSNRAVIKWSSEEEFPEII